MYARILVLFGVALAAGLAVACGEMTAAHGQSAPGVGTDLPALLQDLQSRDAAVREKAALALGKFGAEGRAAVPALVDLVKDPRTSDLVRREAVEALGQIGPEARAAVGALFALLDRPDSDDPFIPIGSLPGDEQYDSDNDEQRLGDQFLPLRSKAVIALGWIGPAALPELLRALDHPQSHRRQTIGQALGRMQPPEVGPLLVQALADSSPRIREGVALALGKMGPSAKPAVPALTRALEDPSRLVRVRAAKALWKIDGQADAVCKTLGEAIKLKGQMWVDEAKRVQTDEDWESHRIADEAVRLMGPAAIPVRIEQLASDSTDRLSAMVALGDFGPDAKDAVPILVDILQQRGFFYPEAVSTLAKIGPEAKAAVPAIVEAIQDERTHPDTRKDFARALVAIDGWGWAAIRVYSGIYRTVIILGLMGLALLTGLIVWLRRRARAKYPPDPIHW
jgi:HEAT repeat protein